MTEPAVVAVIPARYGSTRFPGKPLVPIAGVPMVVRVLRNARQAGTVDRVIVATDDERIAEAVRADGGEVVMTASDLPSGTDRVWAAAAGLDAGIVVNVQADEPLLPGAVLDALVERLRSDPAADLATPVIRWPRARVLSSDVVTVAKDETGRAWYFSRSVVPWGADPVWRHIGVYAYRAPALERFVTSPPATLELSERLEQLRALSLGLHIAAVEVEAPSLAVDRPEDVAAVERALVTPEQGAAPPPVGVRLVVLDVDGVLTDGRITYAGEVEQILSFDVKDGFGIVALVRAGIEVALLSARDSPALRRRAAELGISVVRAGVADKVDELQRLAAALAVPLHDVCYVGDDEPDLVPMSMVGLSAAPSDASPLVRAAASLTLTRPGGQGAVRELADLLLAQGTGGRRLP
jgi:3-deoxy-D-manno-octulosonate 8-phosphate phosphatase (KDO 8-P phosphatase)